MYVNCSNVSLGVKYSKDKAFKRKQELLQAEASLKQAEETLISDPSASNLEALEKLKNKYDSHFDYIAKGAIVRSRATWYEQGRKGNKYNRGSFTCTCDLQQGFIGDGFECNLNYAGW